PHGDRAPRIETGNDEGRGMSATIVVGVDGSEGSLHALEFALEEARIRKAEVKAVAAWHVPGSVYNTGWVPVAVDPSDFEQITRNALDRVLVEADAKKSGVSVTPLVRQGQPADVLVAEAQGADLLVVGSRGLGGFKGLLLG